MARKNRGSLWIEKLLQLADYPNTRDDGTTRRALFTTLNGDVQYGEVRPTVLEDLDSDTIIRVNGADNNTDTDSIDFFAANSLRMTVTPTLQSFLGDLRLGAYPNSRDDGQTRKALYVDSIGDLQYGEVCTSCIEDADGDTRITVDNNGVDQDIIQFITANQVKAQIFPTLINLTEVTRFIPGTAGTPSIQVGENDTGFFSPSSGSLGATADGTSVALFTPTDLTLSAGVDLTMSATGRIVAALGNEGNPGYTFLGDLNTGIFSPGNNRVSLTAGGQTGIEVEFNDIFLPQFPETRDDGPTDKALYVNGTTGELRYGPIVLEGGDLPGLLTTFGTQVITTAGVRPALTQVVENDPGVIDRDDVNTSRINIGEAGLYLIAYEFDIAAPVNESNVEINVDVFANGATPVLGTFHQTNVFRDGSIPGAAVGTRLSHSQTVQLPAGYIELEIRKVFIAGTDGDVSLRNAGTFSVVRLRGPTGPVGPTGPGSSVNVRRNNVLSAGTPHTDLDFQRHTVLNAGSGRVTLNPHTGQGHTDATVTAESTTTSATFQTKTTITTPSLRAGRYRIAAQFAWGYNVLGRNFRARILQDGATVLKTLSMEPKDAGGDIEYPGSMIAYVNLTAGVHTFQLQYASQLAGDVARIEQATLEAWRVS